jgi:hypothetical protein
METFTSVCVPDSRSLVAVAGRKPVSLGGEHDHPDIIRMVIGKMAKCSSSNMPQSKRTFNAYGDNLIALWRKEDT